MANSSRAAVVGELAASVAHELTEPIAAILGNAEAIDSVLDAEQPDVAEVKTAIKEIIHDGIRANETIQRLRVLFRRDQVGRPPVNVGEVVHKVSHIVQSSVPAGDISFVLHTDRSLPRIRADRAQLQQAIFNLVRNAVDAVREAKDGLREVVLRVRKIGGRVAIIVFDSGPGIDPSIASRVFDPSFTTKPSGMGMGLAISRLIVEAHGGRLSVAPDSASGATFVIEPPVRSGLRT